MDEIKTNKEEFVSINTPIPSPDITVKRPPFQRKYLIVCACLLVGGMIAVLLAKYFFHISQYTTQKLVSNVTISPHGVTRTPSPFPTPHLIVNVPKFSIASASAEIKDGNIYLIAGGEKQLFIDKEVNKHYYHPYEVPLEFTDAQFSPDKSKMYVKVFGEINYPVLFYLSLNNLTDSHEVGASTEVIWSPDSRYIAFTAAAADCGPNNNILSIVDTDSSNSAQLNFRDSLPSFASQSGEFQYDNLRWLPDSSSLKVHYKYYEDRGCGGPKVLRHEGTMTTPVGKK